MTPRLRTTGRPLCPRPLFCLRALLFLALLLGPAATGSYAYAAEPAPTHPAADESRAGSDSGEGRTPPGRTDSEPPDRPHHPDRPHDPDRPHHPAKTRPAEHPRGEHPGREPSRTTGTADPSATGAASAGTSPAGTGTPTASPGGHSGSASATAPKRPRTPAASPSRTHSAHAVVPPGDFPDDQEVRPAPPSGAPVDTAGHTPRQAVAEPAVPVVGVLPLGSGLVLVGLGVAFLALRLRRT
ncbi:hypothetical protein ACFVTY_12995 [Streptomyces sp. NPDC058067]|uniref:hypothetical protein n=1 Tax=Streptomyces sp. NPDC058067 TaxID=3346324 RepID=UPI0036E727BA